MELRNFFAASLHLSDFYGISLADEDFENMGLHAWDHIGNKNYALYHYTAKVIDHKVELPCNVGTVEAVTRCGEDHQSTVGINAYREDLVNENIEQYVEEWKTNKDPFYISGGYVQYTQIGQTLHFQSHEGTVRILYKGIFADDSGLPMLNFKEIDAIAKYCAFVTKQKEAFMTKDKSTFEIAQYMRQQWQVACDDARSPIYLNQNFMNRLLDVNSSWDRKRYGISYKPLR